MRQRVWSLLIGAGLALGLLVLAEVTVGWTRVLAPWSEIQPRRLLVPVGLLALSHLARCVRAMNWFPDLAPTPAVKTVLLHNLWNNLLPMRTGEASFPLLLRRYGGVGFDRSIPALFLFRWFDLLCVLGLTALTLAFGVGRYWLVSLVLVGLIATVPFLAFAGARLRLGGRLATLSTVLRSPAAKLWRCLGWTLTNWSSKLTAFALMLAAFGDLDFSLGMLGAAFGELTSVLPVHGLAGAGSYEAGVLAGLYGFGVTYERALAAGINLHLFLLSVTLGLGVLGTLVPAPAPPDP